MIVWPVRPVEVFHPKDLNIFLQWEQLRIVFQCGETHKELQRSKQEKDFNIIWILLFIPQQSKSKQASSLSCWRNWSEQKTGQQRTNEEEGEEVNELKQKHGVGGPEWAAHTW